MWKRGGGATHVCLAHPLIELMMVCILFCGSDHFWGVWGVASCSSLVSCWMLIKLMDVDGVDCI